MLSAPSHLASPGCWPCTPQGQGLSGKISCPLRIIPGPLLIFHISLCLCFEVKSCSLQFIEQISGYYHNKRKKKNGCLQKKPHSGSVHQPINQGLSVINQYVTKMLHSISQIKLLLLWIGCHYGQTYFKLLAKAAYLQSDRDCPGWDTIHFDLEHFNLIWKFPQDLETAFLPFILSGCQILIYFQTWQKGREQHGSS